MPAATVHKVLASELGADWRRQVPSSSTTARPRPPASARCTGRSGRPHGRAGRGQGAVPGRRRRRCSSDLNQLSPAGRPVPRRAARAWTSSRCSPSCGPGSPRSSTTSWRRQPSRRSPRRTPATTRSSSRGGRRRRAGAGHRVDRRHAAVAGDPRRRRRSSATAPGCCWRAALLRPGRGPGCCTPTRTRATSGCSPTGGSACSTSARSPGCPDGHAGADRPAGPAGAGRRRRGGARRAARGGLRQARRRASTREAVLDYLRPMLEPIAGRGVPVHPGLAARPRRRGWPTRAARRTSSAGSSTCRPSYLLIHRVTLGSIGVLCQLEARARLPVHRGAVAARLRRAGPRRGPGPAWPPPMTGAGVRALPSTPLPGAVTGSRPSGPGAARADMRDAPGRSRPVERTVAWSGPREAVLA